MTSDRTMAHFLAAATAVATVLFVAPLETADAAAPMISVPDAHDHGDHDHGRAGPVVPVGVCGALELVGPVEAGLCTHGADTAPAAAPRNVPGAPVPTQAATCIGTGSDGQRVEVLYVHGPGSAAASSGRRTQIRRWSEQVEWTVRESARRLGGDRRVRWRHDRSCDVVVPSRQVSSRALGSFSTMVDELRDAGYDRSDRTYLLFVDSDRYCGIGTATRDDSPTRNAADRTAGYARVDRPCWTAGDDGYHSIAAHEVLHTLGAVQDSAPHATGGAHCTDEHDLLCYDDGAGGSMTTVCRDGDSSTSGAGDAYDRLLDCRGDDYFDPMPVSGSYLDKHWNTADSARLLDPAAPRQSGGSTGSPSPTSNPIGYVFELVFG